MKLAVVAAVFLLSQQATRTAEAESESLACEVKNPKCSALSPDGKRLFVGRFHDRDPRIVVIDVDTWSIVDQIEGPDDDVNAIAVTPDGKSMLVASDDSTVTTWRLSDRKAKSEFKNHEAQVKSVGISAKGNIVVSCGCDGRLRVWNPTNGKEARNVLTSIFIPNSLAISPDRSCIAVGGSSEDVEVYSVDRLEKRISLRCAKHTVFRVRFSPDGAFLACAAFDKKVLLWRADSYKLSHELKLDADPIDVQYSPDSSKLAVAESTGAVSIFNVKSGRRLIELTSGRQYGGGLSVVYGPDGKWIATTFGSHVVKWPIAVK